MKNKIIIVTGIIVILLVIVLLLNNKNETLVKPEVVIPTPESTIVFNSPKEIKFDSSTDLKNELDSVNPQVLDSDFD